MYIGPASLVKAQTLASPHQGIDVSVRIDVVLLTKRPMATTNGLFYCILAYDGLPVVRNLRQPDVAVKKYLHESEGIIALSNQPHIEKLHDKFLKNLHNLPNALPYFLISNANSTLFCFQEECAELLRQSGALIDERIHRSRTNMGMLYQAHTFSQVDKSQDWIGHTSTLDKAGSSARKNKDPVAQKPGAVPESVEDRNIAKFPVSLIHSASAGPFPVKLYRMRNIKVVKT